MTIIDVITMILIPGIIVITTTTTTYTTDTISFENAFK